MASLPSQPGPQPISLVNSPMSKNSPLAKPFSTTLSSTSRQALALPSDGNILGSASSVQDPIGFLNSHYATEQALIVNLPVLQETVAARLNSLDDAISHALSRQSETAEKTRQILPQTVASARALQHRIMLVKEKAMESEKAVFTITSDMKRLDCAKRHLQRSITTLKRLHMLVHAVEQLRQTAVIPANVSSSFVVMDYRSAAQLVEATRLLLEFFEAYTAKVEEMKVLSLKVTEYQEALKKNLTRSFRLAAFGYKKASEIEEYRKATFASQSGTTDFGGDEDSEEVDLPSSISTLPAASDLEAGILLMDALGEPSRNEFVHGLCQDYLRDYVRLFEPPLPNESSTKKRVSSFKAPPVDIDQTKSAAGLAEMEMRFKWFQNILQTVVKRFPMFPPRWNVQASMTRHYLQMTRDHVLSLLDGPRKDVDATNAAVLLKAFQKTLVFEKEVSSWLEAQCGAVFVAANCKADASLAKDHALTQAATPPDPRAISLPLLGIASSAFEDYMGPYIRVEEQSMDEQLAEALEDRTVDTRGERPVYISSTNLFVTIKGSITRCTAMTTRKPFYILYRSIQDSLRKYSQVLESKLPAPQASSGISGISIPASFGQAQFAGSASVSGHASTTYRLPKGEEVTVCHVISTCEYCADTVEALEDLIRDTMVGEYCSRVDMSSDQEAFHDITAKAIRVLVSGLTVRVDHGLKALANCNWGGWEAVGEESEYVRTMHEEIEPFVISVRSLLPTSYFRSFCDKFATAFTATYYDMLVRQKKISEPGTQQLLLDVYNLKTLFMKLPVLERSQAVGVAMKATKHVGGGSTIAPAIYTKMVQSQFGKIETLLKLVGTPNELLIENFKVQWIGGTTSELQVILGLKGVKRPDQVVYLEKFGVDSASAIKNSTAGVTSSVLVSERVQALHDQGSSVAAKVNSDLSQMRLKVDDFRKTWRTSSNL